VFGQGPRLERRSLLGADEALLEGDDAVAGVEEDRPKHLRTTNPVEFPFAAVRLRTNAGKRYKKVANATALIWRLLMVAERTSRRFDHPELLPEVAMGARYGNGIRIVRRGNREHRPGGCRLISFPHLLTRALAHRLWGPVDQK
jgi:hypothetical protein